MAKIRIPKVEKPEQPETPETPEAEPVIAEPTAAEQAANVLDMPTEEPVTEQPVTEQIVADEPASEQPADEEPIQATLQPEEPPAKTEPAEIVGSWRAGDTSPPTASATAKERAEAHWKNRCEDASREFVNAAIRRREAEADLKAAKEDEKSCLERYMKLVEEGPRQLVFTDSSVTPPDGEGSGQPSATTEPLPTDENGWRTVPITALDLGNIDGLGDKKREALIDAVPTLGHFEDKRVEAGASGVDTVLPKGIGKKITDPLEEMHLTYLTNWNARQQASSQGQGTAAATATETAAESTEPAAEAAAQEPPVPTAAEWEAMTEEQQHDWLQARSAQISESADFETVSSQIDDQNPVAYQSGVIAYGRGEHSSGCPYIPGDEMDQWLYGFFVAARIEDEQGAEVEPPLEADRIETVEGYEAEEGIGENGHDLVGAAAPWQPLHPSIDDL